MRDPQSLRTTGWALLLAGACSLVLGLLNDDPTPLLLGAVTGLLALALLVQGRRP